MESMTVQHIYESISSLAEDVKAIRCEMEENFVIAQLEHLCYELKCSIIDADLKIPEVSIFSKYLRRLTKAGDIMYVSSLLRQCWRYAYPQSLLDAPVKDLSAEALVDMALSKYSGNTSNCTADTFNEKYYPQYAKWAVRVESMRKENKIDLSLHHMLLNDLFIIIDEVGRAQSVFITPDFLSYRAISSPLSQAQLSSVFDTLVSLGCTRVHDKNAFLASFTNAVQARQSQVCWLATNPKNGTVNYAKLYALFQVLKVQLSESAKSIIAETFVSADGSALKPSSIKARENTKELQSFKSNLLGAID